MNGVFERSALPRLLRRLRQMDRICKSWQQCRRRFGKRYRSRLTRMLRAVGEWDSAIIQLVRWRDYQPSAREEDATRHVERYCMVFVPIDTKGAAS